MPSENVYIELVASYMRTRLHLESKENSSNRNWQAKVLGFRIVVSLTYNNLR